MNIFEVEVTQTDCPHVHTSSKFPGTYILIMNTEDLSGTQTMFSIFYSADSTQLAEALKYFSEQPEVSDFILTSRKENIASVMYKTHKTSLFKKVTMTGFRIHPVVVHRGVERWFVICGGGENLDEEFINDNFTIVLSLKRLATFEFFEKYLAGLYGLNFIDIFSEISDEDRNILSKAVENGYFDWPRRIKLSDLGKNLNIPKSTLSYHVRKIEKKVVQIMDSNGVLLQNSRENNSKGKKVRAITETE